MNYEMMSKVKTAIKASETFDMSFVSKSGDKHRCDTPGCVLGHLISVMGGLSDDDDRWPHHILADEFDISVEDSVDIYNGDFSDERTMSAITKAETLAHLESLERKYRAEEKAE